MIKIKHIEIKEDNELQTRKLSFYLKVPRSVWLTDDKLTLEYPLKFSNLNNIGDAIAFSLLPIAYLEGYDIEFPANLFIEQQTQEKIDAICNLWNKWFLRERHVKCFASIAPMAADSSCKRYGAQLFSGGVDSTTTFKKYKEEIKYLIFYNGSDIPLKKQGRFSIVKNYIEEFSREHDKEAVVISTNFHYLSQASWERLAHGCAMIGPVLSLSNYIDKLYVAASFSHEYRKKLPWGSHPDLDHLISLKKMEVIHDGFGLSRIEKIRFISEDTRFLEHLRVCIKDNITGHNCGACEKCYRTAISLSLLDIPDKNTSFPKQAFSLYNIANFIRIEKLQGELRLPWSQNLEELELSSLRLEGKSELIQVLRQNLGSYYKKYRQKLFDNLDTPCIGRWQKLERILMLKPDSLLWLKKAIRSFRGVPYRNFIKRYVPLQDVG